MILVKIYSSCIVSSQLRCLHGHLSYVCVCTDIFHKESEVCTFKCVLIFWSVFDGATVSDKDMLTRKLSEIPMGEATKSRSLQAWGCNIHQTDVKFLKNTSLIQVNQWCTAVSKEVERNCMACAVPTPERKRSIL